MAREPRAPRPKLDQPGQRPLLKGHLRPGGRRGGEDKPAGAESEAPSSTAGSADPAEAAEVPAGAPAAEPASEVAQGQADVVRGKATRSPAEVATRKHLEGSEQGPM